MEDQRHNSPLALEQQKNTDPKIISRRGSLITAAVRGVEVPKTIAPKDTKFERVLAELIANKPSLPKEATETVLASTFDSPQADFERSIPAYQTSEKPAETLLPVQASTETLPRGFDLDYSAERQEKPPHTLYSGESVHELHEVDLHGPAEEIVQLRGIGRNQAEQPPKPVETTVSLAIPEVQPRPLEATTSDVIAPSAEQSTAYAAEQPAPTPVVFEQPRRMPKSERPIPTSTLMERFRNAQSEKGFTARLEKLLPKRAEQQLGKTDQADQLHVPQEHRLQTSAWHSIEIDSKTGKPVENGTFEYGHEYNQERAHETTPRTNSRDAAAGEVALVAASMPVTDDQPSTQTPPSPAPTPPAKPAQHHATELKTKAADIARKSMQSSGPVWPFVAAFAVVVVLLILAFS